MPKAVLFAIGLFIAGEALVTAAWRPAVVGADRYARFSLAYDYGYAKDMPRLFLEGDSLCYYPTEYVDMPPFCLDRQKGLNEIRIFVLGGSVSRGYNVPLGLAYPERLETLLNEHRPEFEWTVLNLSASGFGSTRILNVLNNMVEFQPDVIVVHPHGSNEYEDERDARYRADLHGGINGLLLRSRLVVLIKKLDSLWLDTGEKSNTPDNGESVAGRDPANRDRWFATLSQNVEQIHGLAEAEELATIYVGRSERDSEAFRGDTVEHLNGPIRDLESFVDVATLFTEEGSEFQPTDLFHDWTHYSKTGHRILAEDLYRLLSPGGEVFARVMDRRDARALP